jgi:predicted ATPase
VAAVPASAGLAGSRASAVPRGLAGRDRELSELRDLTGAGGLVTMAGAGGTGKTALLRALLAALADRFPDGIFRVDLGDLHWPDLVPARVAAALGVWEEAGVPLAETLAAALRGRPAVLALDGCDQLADACADLCRRLLADSPELLIVTASRHALGVAGETVWPIPPLTLPAPEERDPGQAARSGAVRLFAERARDARPGFVLDAGNGPAVAAICRAAGGLPLAIELAAAPIRDLDSGQIAARLRAWPGLAGAGEPPGPAAHGPTVRAVIAWSHSLLEPDEQVLLRRLSVLAGWSMEAAERVCADDGLPAARIAGLMTRLAEWSLVEVRPAHSGPDRYRMAGAVRDFAAGCLAAAGETAALRRRLRDYAAHVAEYISSIGTARVPVTWRVLTEVFSTYAAQADNIRAVLAQSLADGDAEAGLRICTAVRLCWGVRGAMSEGIAWLDAFLDSSLAAASGAARGPALIARAQLALSIGDLPQAESLASAGLELSRAADDPGSAAAALDVLARTALRTGQPEEALRRAAEAVELTGRSGDSWNRGYAIGNMASALAVMGKVAEAREWSEAGLALMTDMDHQWGAALFRVGLGDLARRAGDLDAARAHYLAALPPIREIMPAPEIARCLARLGRIAVAQGDPGAARGYLTDSLQLSLAVGGRGRIARSLVAFADLAFLEGGPDRAVLLAAAATALGRGAQPPSPPSGRTRRLLDAAASLGPAQVDRLWAEGLSLTSREAARLALEPPH